MQAEKVKQYKKAKHMIVQRYIDNPLLINGYKFDLRVYVLVTSFDPLRVYIFENGLVRFCTAKYSTKVSQVLEVNVVSSLMCVVSQISKLFLSRYFFQTLIIYVFSLSTVML